MKALRLLWLALPLACASPGTPRVPSHPEAPSTQVAPAVTTATVEGRVQSATHAPVAGAMVALVPARADWNPDLAPPAARMRTGPDGRFHFEGLAPGAYGLTVSAAAHEAGFLMDVKLAAGEAPRQLEVVLAPPTQVLRGSVKSEEGVPLAGAWLHLGRYSDFLGDMLYVQTDERGAYEVALPAGGYGVAVMAKGFMPMGRSLEIAASKPVTELDFTALALPETAPPSPEVVSWVKQSLVPLSTVEAGHGFADLQPLKPWLAQARVVALGEATHGTREFFQLKHRLLEFLATELGFTVFAIEASFGEALALNDYVLTGKGDPAKGLAGLSFWTWDTEEVLALIRWMRAYNADPRHPRKLKFYGVDMQATAASAQAVLDFFAQADPAFHQRLAGPLAPFLDKQQGPELRQVETGKVLAGLVADIEARLRQLPTRKTSAKAQALVARHARVLGQFAEAVVSQFADDGHRDLAMAENARWILEHEGPEARMVLWAHNAHVAATGPQGVTPMGQHLREALGPRLYVFGFAFNQGEFQAVHVPSEPNEERRGLSVHSLPAAEIGTLEGALALAQVPTFALDLRGLPRGGGVSEFFMHPRYTRNYGAVFSKAIQPRSVRAASAYDGLLFVEHTQAAVPTPTGRRPPPGQQVHGTP
ncbi:erythromycin esterase family protein [Pyxidicoccus parkwayensis]|uniref:Erythromycin esterase family protein n=1 Tax=Pyxidicoccus parkwayensis TaxID=2813578 RepID=A0ABX7NZ45_9BACT|nr:erythromycin esterase family protein [Pyxidicoccus parkwaysis]QSQ22666.1 erythromycin esterase family protein [Pyxidicoccus parkwaysis]